MRRSSTDGNWGTSVELTTASPYSMNHQPAISSDGAKVVFECTNETYSGVGCICEVGTDGQGFRVVLTPTDSPVGLPDEADMHSPDYAPDGSIVFEADWDGEQIWRLPVNATAPVRITDAFNFHRREKIWNTKHPNQNANCVARNLRGRA